MATPGETATKKPKAKAKPKAAKAPAKKAAAKASSGNGALVVVESPAKAKTIKKYLGRGYDVKASVGHVKDLPKSALGVDIEHDFQPTYELIKGKQKVIDEIAKAASKADRV